MSDASLASWDRFQRHYHSFPSLRLALDLSKVDWDPAFFEKMRGPIQAAFASMSALESGDIANPDEKRRVGHYWLRNPALAPDATDRQVIIDTVAAVKRFAAEIHQGQVAGQGGRFTNVLVIGIGGSALGPQFVAQALGQPATDRMQPYFLDNTDPDGMDRVFARIGDAHLGQTLCVVISKSGGTKETRNGMLEAEARYRRAGLDFARHAVAVTGAGSELDRQAAGWLRRFPMWDWVGGRTSETSAVGLLPAALQGLDVDGFLEGARLADEQTRKPELEQNPAALMALAWFFIGNGKGTKDMVVLPYKDRLELFSKYLQQLVMESLGKELDLGGQVVHQGLAVYGNKGSTDQHAYVQQLRDGINNFFVTFIGVLRDRSGETVWVEPQVSSGDFLYGFLLGTRQALAEKGRQSITLTLDVVDSAAIGMLIALFERAVGLYARLINVNAYHQPGVEAGKKAAEGLIGLQRQIIAYYATHADRALTVAELGAELQAHGREEAVFQICQHLAGNGRLRRASGPTAPGQVMFSA